ncbi:MAG: 50S ribosomal protein L15 [Alphaproteobacteria bacterium]|nr:50S ribosomal protein L15 [Alphaproteobacteria bacterium]
MRLNQLRDRTGSRKGKKRLGRGVGSGLGKTSGRGHKGAKARSGVWIKGFEGGQMPLHRRLPKRGFNYIFRAHYVEVGLDRVQLAIDEGRLDAAQPIDAAALVKAGVIRRMKDGVRYLANGEIKAKVALHGAGASKSAMAAVEKAGGSITLPPKKEAPEKKKKEKKAKKPAAEE